MGVGCNRRKWDADALSGAVKPPKDARYPLGRKAPAEPCRAAFGSRLPIAAAGQRRAEKRYQEAAIQKERVCPAAAFSARGCAAHRQPVRCNGNTLPAIKNCRRNPALREPNRQWVTMQRSSALALSERVDKMGSLGLCFLHCAARSSGPRQRGREHRPAPEGRVRGAYATPSPESVGAVSICATSASGGSSSGKPIFHSRQAMLAAISVRPRLSA